MPETSESIPLIGIYLTFEMAMTTVSVIMTVMVLNFFYRGPALTPVPAWAKKYIVSKGNLSSPSFPYRSQNASSARQAGIRQGAPRRNWRNFSTRYNLDILKNHLIKATNRDGSNGTVPVSPHMPLQFALNPEGETTHPFMDNINIPNSSSEHHDKDHCSESFRDSEEDLIKVLRILLEKEDQQNKDDQIRREWRMLAEIIDKWLFWSFFTITTLSTAIFIVILPYGKRGKFF